MNIIFKLLILIVFALLSSCSMETGTATGTALDRLATRAQNITSMVEQAIQMAAEAKAKKGGR